MRLRVASTVESTRRMASTPQRFIAIVAMLVIALGAAWLVLVSWLSTAGVYENNQDSSDSGLYLVASLVGLGATIGVIAGLWRRSRILTALAVLVQAASVVFVLLVMATSEQRLGEEDREFIFILVGVLAVDVVAGAAVVAREPT